MGSTLFDDGSELAMILSDTHLPTSEGGKAEQCEEIWRFISCYDLHEKLKPGPRMVAAASVCYSGLLGSVK